MFKSSIWRGFWCVLASACFVGATYAEDVSYFADKRSLVPNLTQTGPTCGLVSAAGMLAGAGWGQGANAQERAQNIQKQLVGRYPAGEFPSVAMNWWLQTYSCTGQSPYYSVTEILYPLAGATKVEYEHLLDELKRCQFVGVDWYWNDPKDGTRKGHAMALVAGNKCYDSNSVWRDGNTAAADDVASNSYAGTDENWRVTFAGPHTVPSDAVARYAELLCPGKPSWAVQQYDVQWNAATDKLTETGLKKDVYADPKWEGNKLIIGNARDESITKQLFLELKFNEAQGPSLDLGSLISVAAPDSSVALRGQWYWYDDNKSALAKFVLSPQPASETITFGDDLKSKLASVNLATYCVPLPIAFVQGAVVLLSVVAITLLRRRFAARR